MTISTDKQKIDELLTRGVENIYPNREFLKALLKKGKRISLYVGVDPTAPDLHIGHSIFMRKLRAFQELGHRIILLIGDFTGMIGDPTDKSAARVRLSREQVIENAKTYKEQAGKILDFNSNNPPEILYNSQWLSELGFENIVELASHFTVQQMLTRDMFEKRMQDDKPIYLHEFLYPLMQGYDCVAMDVDGEVGGNDQMFNMLAGRTLMKAMKGKDKFVMTLKLLADTQGKKMGKSEGNMIRMSDSPDEIFGKVMSWSDGMILGGFELVTDVPMNEIANIKNELEGGANPRDIKANLAFEVVKGFHDEDSAKSARDSFDKLFKEHEVPEDILELSVKPGATIMDVLIESKFADSNSVARRLIDGGGVKLNGELVSDYELEVTVGSLIQKGKRFFVKIV